MAKTSMPCPFPGTLFKDCPAYRGRHYFLFYCEKYRGHLPTESENLPLTQKNSDGKFKMPSFPHLTKDPYSYQML